MTRLSRLNAYKEYQNCRIHGSFDDDGNVLPHCSWIFYEDGDGIVRKHHPRKSNFEGKKEFVDPFYKYGPPKSFM